MSWNNQSIIEYPRQRLHRGWDYKNNVMLYDEFGIDSDGDILKLEYDDDGDRIHRDYYNPDNIILMDYINQKDINDNKIYVGDVIFHKNNLGIFIGVVEWINNEYTSGYAVKWIIGNCSLPWHQFEIIGNVFENPELIGESNANKSN